MNERRPAWLSDRDDGDDGLQVLGRGLDDVDGVPPSIAEHPAAYIVTDGDDPLFGAFLNPDCRDGKHAACGGDAWSDELDQRVACGCSCHGTTDVDVVGGYL